MLRHRLFVFAFCLALTGEAWSQTTAVGMPKSWLLKRDYTEAPRTVMPAFDLDEQLVIDAANQAQKVGPWRFGYEHGVNLGTDNAGEWLTLPNGDRVWRLGLVSPGALSLNLILEEFYMPKGAHVHLYSPDRSQLVGAYTDRNNSPAAMLGTSLIQGEELVLEYYEPAAVQGQGRLRVGVVVHGYRSLGGMFKALNDSGNCNHDVGCPLGAGWEDPISSVALIIDGGGICTGAMVNNTAQDGTPYFLTANHCLGGEAAWVFRFNWNSTTPVCATTANSTDPGGPYDEINGCVRRANRAGSDFALLELNARPDPTWGVMYAGWDRSDVPPTQGTGIHHPSGDIKKICRENQALTTAAWGGAQTWRVADWDLGVTEPGSSGSPLFDQNQRIVGQLYGGGAACTGGGNGTNDNGQPDYYGRFAISWTGPSAAQRLSDWLDPLGTAPTTLDAINPNLPTQNDDAGLANVLGIEPSMCNTTTINPQVRLRNYGLNALTSVDIYYNLDGGTNLVYNWTGNLPSLGSEVVQLPAMTVGTSGVHVFNAFTDNPNAGVDPNALNNSASFNFYVTLNGQIATLALQRDEYGSETTWRVTDANGNTVASGGPYTDVFQQPPLETIQLCLADGCYTFTIFDSYGDGLQGSQVNGNYTITDPLGTVLVQMTTVNFGNSASHQFCINSNVAAPTANITAATSACVGNMVPFLTQTMGNHPSTTYAWTFPGGNPATSTQTTPMVVFANPGIHTVQLIASNSAGSDTVTHTILIAANTISQSGNITQPTAGNNDGSVAVTVTGGTPPFVYLWSNGSTSALLNNIPAGTYTLTVTDSNGCISTQSYLVTPLSLEQWGDLMRCELYPNPTSGGLYLEIDLQNSQALRLDWYSATGQLLQSALLPADTRHRSSQDLSALPSGVYFLKIGLSDGQTLTRRVVKF